MSAALVIHSHAAVNALCADLRARRRELRLTQEQVAAQVGVSAETLCSWENGRKIPTARNLISWAEVLGTRLVLMMGDEHV